MSTSLVHLSPKLTGDHDLNGLDHHIAQLKQKPMEQLVAIVYLQTQKIVTDYDKAETYPVVGIVAIEVVGDALTCPPAISEAFAKARDRRMGGTQKPFEFHEPDDGSQTTVKEDRPALMIEAGTAEIVDADVDEEPALIYDEAKGSWMCTCVCHGLVGYDCTCPDSDAYECGTIQEAECEEDEDDEPEDDELGEDEDDA